MSFNGSEQMLFDYLQTHREERQHWENKVRMLAAAMGDVHAASTELESGLWGYFKERSGVVRVFKEFAEREGLQRTSLRTLAEYLLRLWTPPRPKQKTLRDKPMQ